ncbi:MAG: ATP-binding protein [Clostridiales bacterium]|nr:ATP-binding protein [Clostridiales bacterium]
MIPKELINTILLDYEKTREENKKIHAEKLNMLYSQFPQLNEIKKQLETLGLQLTSTVLKRPNDSEKIIAEFEKKTHALLQERAYLMTENNIPLDSIELQYDCIHCKDTGYLENNKKCSCFNQKLVNHLYDMSNIKETIELENFNTFNIQVFSDSSSGEISTQRDNITQILASIENYTYNFSPLKSRNLLFYGPTGQGKTFFCNSIAKYLMDKGYLVIYQTAFRLIDIIEKYRFSPKTEFSKNKYNLLFDADLLILDDLGTEFNNSFTNTEIFNIINGRLLSKRATIISTNLTLGEIEKVYSKRVSSRIYGNFDIYKFYGPDVRWNTR